MLPEVVCYIHKNLFNAKSRQDVKFKRNLGALLLWGPSTFNPFVDDILP